MASISNIFIDQGATFTTTVTVTDSSGSAVNLSGYSVAAQIRKTFLSASATAFTASISNASSGEITISLSPTQTAALEAGRFVYDVVITASGGTKTRVVEGQVTVNPSVTRQLMSISATLSNNAGLQSSIGSVSQVRGSVSQGNEVVVTRVTIPGPAGPQGAAGSSENIIAQAADVDVSGLADGALLQYRASDQKFVARNQLDTTTGQLVFNGGNF